MDESRHQEVARCLFRESNDALFLFDPRDHRLVDVNPAGQRLTGFGKKELRRLTVDDLFTSVTPGGITRLIDAYLATGFFHSREGYGLVRASGAPIPVNISVSRVHTQPDPLGLAVVRDVSERKRAEAALRESEERYRLLFESNPQPMWVVDLGTLSFLEVNDAAIRRYGYTREEFAALTTRDLIIEPETAEATAEPPRPQKGVGPSVVFRRHRKKDGTAIDVELIEHQVLFRGRPSKLVLSQDVTERKRAEQALLRQALHDTLTGLPNRALLQQRIGQAAGVRGGTPSPFALLLIDLDRFKEVNDTLGHHCGDLVLREVSGRLKGVVRESDTVARLGGDEFAVFLPGADERSASRLAARLIEAMKPPFVLEGVGYDVGASIGIALSPDHGTDPDRVMQHADVAMYAAKRGRSGYVVYRPELDEESPPWLALASELRRGIDEGQLLLHYQPEVDLRAVRVRGAEALVRWQHPTEGLLAPGRFLSLAEETGLTEPLGQWVLRSALDQCRAWERAGLRLRVAVNVSAASLHDGLPRTLADLIEVTGASADRLALEVTEGAVMSDPARARDVLAQVRAQGVVVAIDDFGSGRFPLAGLRALPVDELKLDRSLIEGVAHDPRSASFVRSVVDLGHALGLTVAAEGVEDRATLDLLAALGCDVAQGYHLGRPMPAEDFAAIGLVESTMPEACQTLMCAN